MKKSRLLVIIGPTASGKTARGVSCARYFGGEIVSGDSRQIYIGMDIGTGKDVEEYGNVPVHMIDIVPAGYKYNLYEFLRDANASIDNIYIKGKLPIVVGGSGMYVESLVNGLRLPEVPENKPLRESLKDKSLDELTQILASMKSLHNTTDVDTAKRAIRAIEIEEFYKNNPLLSENVNPHPIEDAMIIGIDIPRDERRRRITKRLYDRIDNGMIDEVRGLLSSGVSAESLIYYGLEYKYITEYVLGKTGFKTMVDSLEIAIHQFAKRQMTWFRGMERRGHKIHWLPYDLSEQDFIENIKELMYI